MGSKGKPPAQVVVKPMPYGWQRNLRLLKSFFKISSTRCEKGLGVQFIYIPLTESPDTSPLQDSMDDKVIAITGGASGIGLALVKLLASRNAKLSISDMNTAGLAALEAELKAEHPDFLYTTLDITKEDEVNAWITATKKHFGSLHGAANCAGIVGTTNTAMPLAEIETKNWDLCLGVNLTGQLLTGLLPL